MPNLLGPKQAIILVELKGPKVEHTGVVAGMSGSPVYIEGKLAGALSLRFGIFTKEPLAGVTPIENVLEVQSAAEPQKAQRSNGSQALESSKQDDATQGTQIPAPVQYAVTAEFLPRVGEGAGAYLAPIETPLVFSGFHSAAVSRFAEQLAGYGMVATQGGIAAPQSDDAQLKQGDMVSMVLAQGDLSIQASCTVSAVVGDRVFACGHPLFSFGSVELPMARGRVLTTLSSALASTKIVNAGGTIGTITQDRLTAVMGRLGPAPRMVPMELTIATPAQQKQFRFELIENPKLTPLLVAIAAFNGLVANTAYGVNFGFSISSNRNCFCCAGVAMVSSMGTSRGAGPSRPITAVNRSWVMVPMVPPALTILVEANAEESVVSTRPRAMGSSTDPKLNRGCPQANTRSPTTADTVHDA